MVKIVLVSLMTFLFSVNFTFSQLYTTTMYSYQQLCTDILSWPGVDVVSVNYTGAPQAIGYFDSQNANVGIDKGLIMTTGTVLTTDPYGPSGPNNLSNSGIDNGQLGFDLLTALAGNITYNAAVLEIDFVAQASELELTYVFGSEEYPEYVCSQFNDIFGIFISGPGYQDNTIISTVPGTSTFVHVNTVNSGNVGSTQDSDAQYCIDLDSNWQDNSVYYIHNGNGNQAPYNSSDEYIQYDGLTVPLTAMANLEIGVQYKLTIAIADVGDGIYDSGLFIQANAISTVGIPELKTTEKIVVYPNPNDGLFKVIVADKGLSNYKITDSSGRTIKAGEIMINDSELNFHLTDKGVYILQLFNDGEIFTERIVVH